MLKDDLTVRFQNHLRTYGTLTAVLPSMRSAKSASLWTFGLIKDVAHTFASQVTG